MKNIHEEINRFPGWDVVGDVMLENFVQYAFRSCCGWRRLNGHSIDVESWFVLDLGKGLLLQQYSKDQITSPRCDQMDRGIDGLGQTSSELYAKL